MDTPVHAAADGVVLQAGIMSGYGKMVVIDHGSGVTTRYAHLSSFGVIPGQEIRRGDVLGQSGDTGKVTSPHLHFEVRHGGIAVDPMTYLTHSMTMQRVQPGLPF
jgi:murein DD-endopeptidase MepM/ murein hydrolase activator NlpD